MRLVKLMADIEDYKSWLWVPLTLKQNFELYLKSSRQRERELISLLFMLDFKQASENQNLIHNNLRFNFCKNEIYSMLKFNKYVECSLNILMYEKYTKLWENQTTKAKIEKLIKFWKEIKGYQVDELEFIKFIHNTNQKWEQIVSNFENICRLNE